MACVFLFAEHPLIESFEILEAASVELTQPGAELSDVRRNHHPAEATVMRDALVETGWNVSEAARKLGVPRVTFHRRMKRFGLRPPPR